MITITQVFDKYKMKFSAPGMGWRGFSVVIGNMQQMHTALDHYHGQPHEQAGCPLCNRELSAPLPISRTQPQKAVPC